ncbi:hypothetical protein CYY_009859 [Polysphondylium violaceum]|uniref:very-long-chain (3R)-3-hydroxyacyl-CoA dehydratase n=1 Tax=Polysphondylium violaceum TaxID=133409 RepID=A0A8J4UP79_9MYCE|nr:hypothetical protein CYY_009859 [Polysphondylium violaceum]
MKPLLGKKYLLCYNSFQALGWYYIVISLFFRSFLGVSSLETTFQALGSIVCTLQVFAFLEIVHVMMGIVKSSLVPTFAQVIGRNTVLLALCYTEEVQVHWGVALLFLFWGLSELIRFPYYIFNPAPQFLTWLRYNAFIVLYPIGFGAENLLWYHMLPVIKEYGILSLSMPNSLNFAFNFYYYALVWILITLLGFPKQYLYMFSLRKKKMMVPEKAD